MFYKFLILTLFLTNTALAQYTLSGTVRTVDGKPIEYVSIGIIGGQTGTVSDSNGAFELTFSQEEATQPLRFSSIGYKNKDVQLQAVDASQPLKIVLEKEVYELETITVDARKYKKTKVLGSKTTKDNVTVYFASSTPGTAVGLLIPIKKEETWIREARFNIAENSFGTVIFRIKIYEIHDKTVGKELLKENVIVETDMESGELKVDLSNQNLVVNDDILLSLEWIGKSSTTGNMGFCGNLLGGPVYVRKASQSYWEIPGKAGLINVGVGFNILASY